MPSDGVWSITTGQLDGNPLIFRIRGEPPAFAGRASFGELLAVTWPYESPDVHGMPAEEVVARMGELEDLLQPALEEAELAFLAVVVTGNGIREWQWYACDLDRVMQRVNEILADREPFVVEFVSQPDPEWKWYERYRDLAKPEQ